MIYFIYWTIYGVYNAGWWELTSEALFCNYINKSWASWMWLVLQKSSQLRSQSSQPLPDLFCNHFLLCSARADIYDLSRSGPADYYCSLITCITSGANLFFMTQSLKSKMILLDKLFKSQINVRVTDCHTVSHSTSFQLHFLSIVTKNVRVMTTKSHAD